MGKKRQATIFDRIDNLLPAVFVIGILVILVISEIDSRIIVAGMALAFSIFLCILYYKIQINRPAKIIYYDMTKLDNMNEYDFEEFICDTYKNKGYKKAYTTPKSGDYGADIIIPDKINTIAIQVKKYAPSSPTGIEAVQEVIGALHHYRATKGMVITTSYFTKAAKILAAESNIELIDREKLINLLNRSC